MKSTIERRSATSVRPRSRLKPILLIAAVAVLLIAGGYFAVGQFASRILQTDKLRNLIASRTGRELDGNAGLHPLSARGFWVHSLGLVITAPPPHALTELRAFGLSSSFSLIELWRGKWRLDHIAVRHFQAAYGEPAARLLDRKEFPTPELVPPAQSESVMSVDVREVSLARADLFWGDPENAGGQIRNAEVRAFPDGKNLKVDGRGGSFREGKWPETRITNFQLYYAKPQLRIDAAHLTIGDRGTIDANGQLEFGQNNSTDLRLKLAHCQIAPFVAKESQSKVDGTFRANVHLEKHGGQAAALTTSGDVAIESALVKNIPALEKAAAFTGEKGLSPLRVNAAHADYRFEGEKLTVRNFQAEARGVLCLRGNFTSTKGDLDGHFELGVAPAIVGKFPGAREEVFTRSEDAYLWTSVKVSGPMDHLNDDLKPRLLAALEKHVALHLLAPILKPAQGAREVLELFFPK